MEGGGGGGKREETDEERGGGRTLLRHDHRPLRIVNVGRLRAPSLMGHPRPGGPASLERDLQVKGGWMGREMP